MDALVVALLVAATLLTRLPFRTSMLFNWDSANFALATRLYDVTQHQPHPPGYLLFVALGKLLLLVTGDANAALVTVALVLSIFVPPLTYLLGAAMFSRLTGIVAALLVLTSVTFWSYGGLALAYPALGLFSTWVAWSAYRTTWLGDRGAWLPLGIAYGIGGGFRPDLLVFLGPIWLAGLVRLGWRRIAASVLLAALSVGFWAIPTVALSGGLDRYMAVLAAYTDRDVLDRYSSTRGGFGALAYNVRDVVSYAWYALYATALPLMAGVVALVIRRPRPDARWLFFATWLAPVLTFYVVVHIGDPGYAFIFLPALAILAGQAIVGIASWLAGSRSVGAAVAVAAVLAAINAGIFLLYPRQLTAPGIHQSDADVAAKIRAIRSMPNDGSILLLSYDSYRHLQYYLPEWESSLWVDPFAAAPVTTELPPTVEAIVLVDNRLNAERGNRVGATPVETAPMTQIPVKPGQTLTFGAGILDLRSP
jgi:hypothetical protein